VGVTEGNDVGDSVGEEVGVLLGAGLGEMDGDMLGDTVGLVVGSLVRQRPHVTGHRRRLSLCDSVPSSTQSPALWSTYSSQYVLLSFPNACSSEPLIASSLHRLMVGPAVGLDEGAFVGPVDGKLVGAIVSPSSEGESVGVLLGAFEGDPVGVCVGDAVGARVQIPQRIGQPASLSSLAQKEATLGWFTPWLEQ
jgi:hypothetical protein